MPRASRSLWSSDALTAFSIDAVLVGVLLMISAMSKRRVTFTGIASFTFLLCAYAVASAQLFTPEQTLGQAHAYEGNTRPANQTATVFVSAIKGLLTNICRVDGKNYFKLTLISGPCGNVVYLLPGTHELTLRYNTGFASGSPTIPIRVEAGKTYHVVGTVVAREGLRVRVATSINTMPQGFALTYKDAYPDYYARTNRPNARINPEDAK